MALLASGGYAEYVAVAASCLLPLPAGLSFVQAAALPEVSATVYSNLCMAAGLAPSRRENVGKSLLVHGGAGGVGSHAIQFGRALGLQVFATAGSEEKCSYVRALGAHAINYRSEDFEDVIAEITHGVGVDFVLDLVGGAYFEKHLRALALDGSMVTIAARKGIKAELNLGLFMKKRLSVYGRTLRAQNIDFKARVLAGVQETVVPLVESGDIVSQVQKVFAFEDVVAVHAFFDSGEHMGKVVLTLE